MSRLVAKATKWLCAQRRFSLIRVFAVRMKKAWVFSYQLSAQRRLWSDWADAQAGLSLRWAHSNFVGFVMRRLKLFRSNGQMKLFKMKIHIHIYCYIRVDQTFPKRYVRIGRQIQDDVTWTASSEFGTYRLCEQRRFRRACASAQSRQNLCCSLIQAVSQEEPSDRKPDPWPLWMAGHAQLNLVTFIYSYKTIKTTSFLRRYWTN